MMKSQQVMPVPICIAETIIDEIEEMYDRITKRAYEIFRERGGNCTLDLEDWLTAERELLYKPEVHVEEVDRRIVVTVRIGRVRPLDVQLLVTPDAIVIQAQPAGTTRKVFRTVQFPRRIDVNKAEATYAEGYLVFTAA